MRLGGPISRDWSDPAEWAAGVKASGYSAAYCPVQEAPDETAIEAYRQAAERQDIVIAEVGAWSNPISPDEGTRRAALALCRERLALADRIGARCCVNIAGSRGREWDGPDPRNLSPDTFDRIVESVREIIDGVRPSRTFYTLETMPWIFPDSPGSYLDIIKAVDRPQFAVHLDPVNLVCSPQRYYATDALIRDCFRKLGPFIKSCHAKDIILREQLTVHLDEVRPGLGGLDYRTFLTELDRLDADTPLMLEHLASAEQYDLAAAHIRSVAQDAGVTIL